jgi:hypothetical protein
MKTSSTRGTFENITFRNTKSFKDFFERKDDIENAIFSNQKVDKGMDMTHQRMFNSYKKGNIVI